MYIGIVNRKTKTWYYDNCFMVKINSCAQLTYSVFHGALAVSTTSLLLSFCSLIYLLLQYWEMNPSIQPCMLGHPSQTLNCRGLSYTLSPPLHTLWSILRQGQRLNFQNWFWTHSVAQSDLDIVILLLQLPEYQGFIPTLPERVNKIYVYIFQHTMIILKDDSLQRMH